MQLHRTPDVDYDLKKTKTTLIAPACLVVYGCTMPAIVLIYYVFPYQTAAGHLLADGSLDWSRGEALLPFTTAALHVPLGLIAAKVIWGRYSPNAKTRNRTARQGQAEFIET